MGTGQSIIALATIIWFLYFTFFVYGGNYDDRPFPWLDAIIQIGGISIVLFVLWALFF